MKVDSNHTCLAVINLDSALEKDENCYPLVFLEECKYIEKKRKLDIFMIICVIFFILISRMKNRLMIFCETNFENAFFEGATLKSLMKNKFLFNRSFITF